VVLKSSEIRKSSDGGEALNRDTPSLEAVIILDDDGTAGREELWTIFSRQIFPANVVFLSLSPHIPFPAATNTPCYSLIPRYN
jgi:hypothetical protein